MNFRLFLINIFKKEKKGKDKEKSIPICLKKISSCIFKCQLFYLGEVTPAKLDKNDFFIIYSDTKFKQLRLQLTYKPSVSFLC